MQLAKNHILMLIQKLKAHHLRLMIKHLMKINMLDLPKFLMMMMIKIMIQMKNNKKKLKDTINYTAETRPII